MKKIMISVLVGAFLFITPVHAQTTKQLNSQLISLIQQLIQIYTAKLNQLLAIQVAGNSGTTTPIEITNSSSTINTPVAQTPVVAPVPMQEINITISPTTSVPSQSTATLNFIISGITDDFANVEIKTTNPDGFNKLGGYKGGESPTATDQTVSARVNGELPNGNRVPWTNSFNIQTNELVPYSDNHLYSSKGTYDYTISLPDLGVSKTVQYTIN